MRANSHARIVTPASEDDAIVHDLLRSVPGSKRLRLRAERARTGVGLKRAFGLTFLVCYKKSPEVRGALRSARDVPTGFARTTAMGGATVIRRLHENRDELSRGTRSEIQIASRPQDSTGRRKNL